MRYSSVSDKRSGRIVAIFSCLQALEGVPLWLLM